MTVNVATNISHHDETQKIRRSGLTLGLAGSVGDAINGAVSQAQAPASGTSDGLATALHAIASGGNAGLAGYGAYRMATGSVRNATSAPDIAVQLSFGTSQSRSTFNEDQTTSRRTRYRLRRRQLRS